MSYIPKWFKDIKASTDELSSATIKTCPGFIDYFKQGYVVSLWCDVYLNITIQNNKLQSALVKYADHDNWSIYDETNIFDLWEPSSNGWEYAEKVLNEINQK